MRWSRLAAAANRGRSAAPWRNRTRYTAATDDPSVLGPGKCLCCEQVVLGCLPRRELQLGSFDPHDMKGDGRPRRGHVGAAGQSLDL